MGDVVNLSERRKAKKRNKLHWSFDLRVSLTDDGDYDGEVLSANEEVASMTPADRLSFIARTLRMLALYANQYQHALTPTPDGKALFCVTVFDQGAVNVIAIPDDVRPFDHDMREWVLRRFAAATQQLAELAHDV